jgi:hypothetical protein
MRIQILTLQSTLFWYRLGGFEYKGCDGFVGKVFFEAFIEGVGTDLPGASAGKWISASVFGQRDAV